MGGIASRPLASKTNFMGITEAEHGKDYPIRHLF